MLFFFLKHNFRQITTHNGDQMTWPLLLFLPNPKEETRIHESNGSFPIQFMSFIKLHFIEVKMQEFTSYINSITQLWSEFMNQRAELEEAGAPLHTSFSLACPGTH